MAGQSSFVPEAWAKQLFVTLRQQPPLIAALAAQAREVDERLRREHPWQWRRKQAAWWLRNRRRAVARFVPVRWVGFGYERDGYE